MIKIWFVFTQILGVLFLFMMCGVIVQFLIYTIEERKIFKTRVDKILEVLNNIVNDKQLIEHCESKNITFDLKLYKDDIVIIYYKLNYDDIENMHIFEKVVKVSKYLPYVTFEKLLKAGIYDVVNNLKVSRGNATLTLSN